MRPSIRRQDSVFTAGFALVNFLLPTIIIMISYTRVFLAVRRQVSSILTSGLAHIGSTTIFGSSVRSAKNLFVMFAYSGLTSY